MNCSGWNARTVPKSCKFKGKGLILRRNYDEQTKWWIKIKRRA